MIIVTVKCIGLLMLYEGLTVLFIMLELLLRPIYVRRYSCGNRAAQYFTVGMLHLH